LQIPKFDANPNPNPNSNPNPNPNRSHSHKPNPMPIYKIRVGQITLRTSELLPKIAQLTECRPTYRPGNPAMRGAKGQGAFTAGKMKF